MRNKTDPFKIKTKRQSHFEVTTVSSSKPSKMIMDDMMGQQHRDLFQTPP
jgi:hypothetical protein